MPAFKAKEPVWVKQSSTFASFAQALDGQTVVFLIQEEAGLLAVFHIHHVADAVFHNLHLGVKFLVR